MMTPQEKFDAARQLLRGVACLPGFLGFAFIFGVAAMHAETRERTLMSVDAVLFGFAALALLYQARYRLSLWEKAFRVMNVVFVMLTAIVLLFYIFNIDPMPRQS
jgi:hypothetical protein